MLVHLKVIIFLRRTQVYLAITTARKKQFFHVLSKKALQQLSWCESKSQVCLTFQHLPSCPCRTRKWQKDSNFGQSLSRVYYNLGHHRRPLDANGKVNWSKNTCHSIFCDICRPIFWDICHSIKKSESLDQVMDEKAVDVSQWMFYLVTG